MYKDIQLKSFSFLTKPEIHERSTSATYTKEQNKDIVKYPFINLTDVSFEIDFLFESHREIKIQDIIPAGFVYNMADIPFMIQPITYDKHSPYVRDASLIHDFILQYKKELYVIWNLKDKGLTHKDFRILSSDIFENVLIQSGVPSKKARLMRNNVDIWQKLLCWSWMRIDK